MHINPRRTIAKHFVYGAISFWYCVQNVLVLIKLTITKSCNDNYVLQLDLKTLPK